MDEIIPNKRCSRCKQSFPITSFYLNKSTKDGRTDRCKECAKQIQAERRSQLKGVTTGSKKCGCCQQVKSLSEFFPYYAYCKACSKDKRRVYYTEKLQNSEKEKERVKKVRLKRSYALSIDEYEAMIIRQSGLCAVCGQLPSDRSVLHIDHCHKSGKVRELLCTHCNSVLGHAHDNPEILRNAARYIEKHS